MLTRIILNSSICFSFLPAGCTQCTHPTTALGQCALLASLREQLRSSRKAEAHIIIARLTSTTKVGGKCNQLTKHTPPLCVIIKVIEYSAGRDLLVGPVTHERSLKKNKCVVQFMRCLRRNNTIFIVVGSRQAYAEIQEVTLMRPFHGNLQ